MLALELRRPRNVTRYLVVVLAFVTATLWGQAPQGEIRVQVKDPSGAPMQASGRLESRAGGVARDFQTDPQGTIILGNLPFGRYQLQISKSGFTTQSISIKASRTRSVTPTHVLAGRDAPAKCRA